jgi:tetratricopeptide (TPR) repeat protein
MKQRKSQHSLKDLKGLKEKIDVENGISAAANGQYEEAIQCLSRYAAKKEVKLILIKCHNNIGKEYAGKKNWSDAQQHFKRVVELGGKNQFIECRLKLLSNIMREKYVLKDYYIKAKVLKTLRVPNIEREAYHPYIDSVICAGIYKWKGDPQASDDWSMLLRRIKKAQSEEAREAGRIAAITLMQCISLETRIFEEVDLIVPVPPDPERFKERKFNIPTLISETISKYSTVPINDDVLIKKYSTPKRATSYYINVALDVYKPYLIKEREILLIDDITTHGHTFRTCGKKLKESGASRVFAAALAHSEPTSDW